MEYAQRVKDRDWITWALFAPMGPQALGPRSGESGWFGVTNSSSFKRNPVASHRPNTSFNSWTPWMQRKERLGPHPQLLNLHPQPIHNL